MRRFLATSQVLNGAKHITITEGMQPIAAYYLPAGSAAYLAFVDYCRESGSHLDGYDKSGKLIALVKGVAE